MPDTTLTPCPSFGDLNCNTEAVALSAATGFALVSIAIPIGLHTHLASLIRFVYGASIPTVGASSLSVNGTDRLLALQPNQLFLLFAYNGHRAVEVVAEKLGNNGYYTDQSDAWTMLRISGPATTAVLGHICMLDLDPAVFPIDAVTRTIMDHLPVIILRESLESFLLMSPRSSAKSFIRAVELSVAHLG